MFCDGCKAPIKADANTSERDWVEVILAPGHTVRLCRSERYWNNFEPKTTCERKARDRLKLCPGCGTDGIVPGTICGGCAAKIERASQERVLQWCVINAGQMMPYLSREDTAKLSDVLARVAAAGIARIASPIDAPRGARRIPSSHGYYDTSGCSSVEMNTEQADAMEQLAAIVKELMEAQYMKGKEEGLSLLTQLGRGEVTVDQFEDRKTRMLHR